MGLVRFWEFSTGLRGLPLGQPPFFPLRRAAAFFASLVLLPPKEPRATAAGFLDIFFLDRCSEKFCAAFVACNTLLIECGMER